MTPVGRAAVAELDLAEAAAAPCGWQRDLSLALRRPAGGYLSGPGGEVLDAAPIF